MKWGTGAFLLITLGAAHASAQTPPRSTTTVRISGAVPEYHSVHRGDTLWDITGYYFTTPSGKWRCAILAHTKAGCQSASGWQSSLGVEGEPDSTNAIVVDRDGDPQFVALEQPEFSLPEGPANTLQFNRILAAAAFRCNVQEAGVSCLSETSGKGFTFSSDGFTPQYTEVPASAR